MQPSKTESISILVVIINYFSHELVNSLLTSLEQQKYQRDIKLRIVCTDNSANSIEHEALRTIQVEGPHDFELAFQTENIGFGPAVNMSTQGRQFDFLWLLNPDVSLFPNTLDELLTVSLDRRNGVTGGLTVTEDLKPDYRHAWPAPTLLNTIGWAFGIKRVSSNPVWHDSYRYHRLGDDLPYRVDNISGCCMLISYDAWCSTQGFDEDFFLYSEEIDLCQRARSLGHQPYVAPNAKLSHRIHSNDVGLARLPLVYSSKLLYAHKHLSGPLRVSFRTIIAAGALLRSAAELLRGKKDRARTWWGVATNACLAKRLRNEERE